MSTGIWIGATPAFQQRVAQREHLATEIAFLEGAFGEKSREKLQGKRWCLGDSPLKFVGFFLGRKNCACLKLSPETSKGWKMRPIFIGVVVVSGSLMPRCFQWLGAVFWG